MLISDRLRHRHRDSLKFEMPFRFRVVGFNSRRIICNALSAYCAYNTTTTTTTMTITIVVIVIFGNISG